MEQAYTFRIALYLFVGLIIYSLLFLVDNTGSADFLLEKFKKRYRVLLRLSVIFLWPGLFIGFIAIAIYQGINDFVKSLIK